MQSSLPNRATNESLPMGACLTATSEELAQVVQSLGQMATRDGLPRDLSRSIEMLATDTEAIYRSARERAAFIETIQQAF